MAKIPEAFARAQLEQEGAESKRQCLTCVRMVDELHCADCNTTQPVAMFAPNMLTLPPGTVACLQCQLKAVRLNTQARGDWFKCRGCKQQLLLSAVSELDSDCRYCLNCATGTGSSNTKGLQKCRGCGQTFRHVQTDAEHRERRCPNCRQSRSSALHPTTP